MGVTRQRPIPIPIFRPLGLLANLMKHLNTFIVRGKVFRGFEIIFARLGNFSYMQTYTLGYLLSSLYVLTLSLPAVTFSSADYL